MVIFISSLTVPTSLRPLPNRDLSNMENYYSTFWKDSNTTMAYYQSVTTIDFDYSDQEMTINIINTIHIPGM